ncbi:diaminopimelate epimerase [Paenibacillus macerans]|uniref:Diaminopimelate epimerase n=1 Tax=Paenibacillus macerans TaxID=44252 RepID=A0A091A0H0_PAEMA|nr:diaminopimelate epimerase [Paenibacillus macerans]KFN09836.1 diaminopimelate epimerase [Paenibacillus macerans]MCY7560329.1 diaminopimelate epimerase [Paenibacillus macerans]MEC0152830.1 diaminopimelate epimerase [Paenibacillus macerans]MEC0331452.1 diaminopimelate epimerase [Paenibacillus macerans]UMV46833.1 diaminopimelate epimerase [Paenibacillus macerans]
MEFTKMHGLGNDFLVFYGHTELPENVSELAVTWCDRYFGVGGDGLVFILPSEQADFKMRIINSDGTEAEQCGNAIRCVSKYVYDNGLVDKENVTIETLGAGVQQVSLQVENGAVKTVRVDMGEPILDGLAVPTTLEDSPVLNRPIEAGGREFSFTAVSMGNPHCVIYVDDAPNFDLTTWGPKLEVHPYFPRKINVEFATVTSRDRVEMRVWERGAGPTLACGTGACATLVSSVLNGLTDRAAWIGLKGGDLFIEWDERDNHVYMTGPAEAVYKGSIEI